LRNRETHLGIDPMQPLDSMLHHSMMDDEMNDESTPMNTVPEDQNENDLASPNQNKRFFNNV